MIGHLLVLVLGLCGQVFGGKPYSTSKIELLHSLDRYDPDFMHEYGKMISSLLLGTPMAADRTLLRGPNEISNSSVDYNRYHQKIARCKYDRLRHLTQVRVLQPEDDNYVSLLRDSASGKFFVSKVVQSGSSFNIEMDFYSKVNTESSFFPTILCGGYVWEMSGYVILMEYIDGRESEIMASRATPQQLRFMAAQLFEAIIEIHRLGYLHADIKPGNVLITDDYRLYIIDFGMATRIHRARGNRGNPHIRAPELQNKVPGGISESIDWWAYGATLSIWYYYQLANLQKSTGAPWYNMPEGAEQPHNLLKAAKDSWSPNMPKTVFATKTSRKRNTPVLYAFAPMVWKHRSFHSQKFPIGLGAVERSFLAMFFPADPELRTFETRRLQDHIRNHNFFADMNWNF